MYRTGVIYKDRLNGKDVTFERERQRDRVNLHNFTGRNVTKEERQILNHGGGFVFERKTYIRWHREAACS